MKILMVSSFLPYPLTSGGHIRLYNLIKELSKRHSVTLIGEKRNYQTDKDILEVGKICKKIITVERKKQWSLGNILKAGFSLYPFLMVGHTNRTLRETISQALQQEKFDVIHIETFYVVQNVPKTSIPIVLAEHNIEYLVYERFAKRVSVILRPFLFFDIAKIKYWEQKIWRKVTKLVAVSEEEKKLMGRENVVVVPNGVDLSNFKFQISRLASKRANFKFQNKEKRILFIGDFRWIQNKDAAEWILKEIWPLIKLKIKNEKLKITLKLWIVGRNIPGSIKNLSGDSNIVFDESASENTSEIFRKADVLLSPIRVGGGTSFKILEAMASGVPVVTTSLGIEGIEAKDNENVLIADSAEGLSCKVIDILENKTKYSKMSARARALIEQKYDWKIIVKRLEEAYESAIDRR